MREFGRQCIATARTILADRRARRLVLFWLTLATLVMLFVGAVPLDQWLSNSPSAFALYWAVCFALVIGIFLLAFYDLLMVLKTGKQERAALKKEIFGETKE